MPTAMWEMSFSQESLNCCIYYGPKKKRSDLWSASGINHFILPLPILSHPILCPVTREIFPYLVVVIGLENVLVLTKSVVSTPVDLEVKLRIAQGQSRT